MNRSKENTWRALEGKERVRTMDEVIAHMQNYVNTYKASTSDCDEMFIEDMLYGIGSALGEEYKFANGYTDFQKRLNEILSTNIKLETRGKTE